MQMQADMDAEETIDAGMEWMWRALFQSVLSSPLLGKQRADP